MSKKYNAPTLIIIFCFVVSIGGLYNNLIYSTPDFNIMVIKQLFDPLNLGWVINGGRSLFQVNGLSYINAIFEGLLLTGVILYVTSKHRESRLIRFVMAIILLSNVLSFTYSLARFCFLIAPWHLKPKDLLFDAFFYIANLFWIYISYQILRYFNTQKELQVEFYEENSTQQLYFTDASLWDRAFHPFIDLIVCIMLFSPLMQFYIFKSSGGGYSFGFPSVSKLTFYVMIILCRLLYYLLFETVLGVTPGKLLTETRVINNEGKKPSPVNVAGRTFLRLIPFEALSFFGYKGLHDKLSNTSVVEEKKTGVRGVYYLWVIPAMMMIVYFYGNIQKEYNQYKEKQVFNAKLDQRDNELKNKLQNLTTNDVIALNSAESQNMAEMTTRTFLKAEKIGQDSITFSIVVVHSPDYEEVPEAVIEKAYSAAKSALPRVTFCRRAILAALRQHGETYMNTPDNVIPLTVNNLKYTVKSIDTYFMANITLGLSHDYGPHYFSIDVANNGWKADLINVQVLEGDIKITTPLPLHLNSKGRILEGTTNGSANDYKLYLTVLDTLNRTQLYEVDGNAGQGTSLSIKKIR